MTDAPTPEPDSSPRYALHLSIFLAAVDRLHAMKQSVPEEAALIRSFLSTQPELATKCDKVISSLTRWAHRVLIYTLDDASGKLSERASAAILGFRSVAGTLKAHSFALQEVGLGAASQIGNESMDIDLDHDEDDTEFKDSHLFNKGTGQRAYVAARRTEPCTWATVFNSFTCVRSSRLPNVSHTQLV
ncbi:hypothetical protein AURDEDRAFT_165820 [Auricularia subglabra TFB-10046 SS5]|nr:hypothetical protein AURDEDRAFT_165820 [Auricularia subglabra TFB-10046 SS5]